MWCLQKRANITLKEQKKQKTFKTKNLQMTRSIYWQKGSNSFQHPWQNKHKSGNNLCMTLIGSQEECALCTYFKRKTRTPSLPCQIYKETTSTTFSSPWKLLPKKNAIPSSCNLKAEACFSSQLYETANIQYHLKRLLGTTFLSNEKTWMKNPAKKHASSRPTSQLKWYQTKNAIIIHAHISRDARS